MGRKYTQWLPLSSTNPGDYNDLSRILMQNREFDPVSDLKYGDHGLTPVVECVYQAIRNQKRIALYADYDVDGTMSCVSWIWFLEALGYTNFVHYIPCRFKEGYGLNLKAVEYLIDEEKADLIITMDTGITANEEAAYCRDRGVEFICTDHHKVQPEKMPDCKILNPKMHPDASYQELCGCGITFVLLRRLAERLPVDPAVWTDLLGLAGMATICDVVPLNGVNHRLAKLGVSALTRSSRSVLRRLMEACRAPDDLDEKDVGFRLGPRINAVGRLEHADLVIKAFVGADPEPLIRYMGECNEKRKQIQKRIVEEARQKAEDHPEDPVLFLGGQWHPGVVGIAASKIADEFWKPVWMFQRQDGLCKGSARSIPGFDVTSAMGAAAEHFSKFGGHTAAGGFSFPEDNEPRLRDALNDYAESMRQRSPDIWTSKIEFDCHLPVEMTSLELADALDGLKPFGHGFEEPKFCIQADISRVRYFYDKTTGEPRHTAVMIEGAGRAPQKILFFNEVLEDVAGASRGRFVVSAARNTFRGTTSLALYGQDYEVEG